ncbi:RidA family protein [Aquabacter spiritensis]|uniref:Reactive intermediate/imine deaminase n=1 Tax=Aquabacter spiritensis TaxID=933073 RepID=A0A4R3M116_9HYPH|nr:RidA family protein [Aquabacter spiritensis]TCT06784.1 reactive intermediate/imine deaminase [Aquabacter spiritensis]
MSDPDILPVLTAGAPAPGGHYTQAIVHGGLVYVSGQLPTVVGAPHDPGAPFETQLRRVLANLDAILAASGSGPDRLLKVTAYIVGGANWPAFNRLYAEHLGETRPARSVVPVPELHYGYLVEIDAIAAQRPASPSGTEPTA